jgi:hypothetical protein
VAQRAKIDRTAILVVVGLVGTTSCLLAAAFWKHSVIVFGRPQSLPLFVLIFLAGGVDCLTSVLFYPMVGRYRSRIALPSLNVGETLTGLVAALLATAQIGGGGSTYQPNFSVGLFFCCLAILMGMSMVAFVALEWGHWATRESAAPDEESVIVKSSQSRFKCPEMHIAMKVLFSQALFSFLENGVHVSMTSHSLAQFPDSGDLISTALKLSFGGGALFSLLATQYHIAWDARARWVALVTLSFGCAFWIILASSMTLNPTFFEPFTVVAVVLLKWSVVYGKTCVFVSMPTPDVLSSSTSTESPPAYDVYRWGGVGMQIGGVTGSLLFFLLAVQWKIFPY